MWTDHAQCKGQETYLFYPSGLNGRPNKNQHAVDRSRDEQEKTIAKVMCTGCSVMLDCLMDAVQRYEKNGVWGGMSSNERYLLYRRMRWHKRDPYKIDSYLVDKEVQIRLRSSKEKKARGFLTTC